MDQFEDTVVNPNISLNNFEVKIREPNNNKSATNNREHTAYVSPKRKSSAKGIFLLALLLSIFIYQISPYL